LICPWLVNSWKKQNHRYKKAESSLLHQIFQLLWCRFS
jgi:hypothetical protein